MPQQRIHEVTAKRLSKIKDRVNKHREKHGMKALTTPDLIESIIGDYDDEFAAKKSK